MKLFKNFNSNKLLYNGLIITFVILYLATAFVSWYHAITFFNIANATWLSVLLSFIAEIGQSSVLFAILLTKNKDKFLQWVIMIILTTLQVIGNVVASYKFIIVNNNLDFLYFQKSILFWVQTTNTEMFKIIIAWISGGILPVIALSMTALVADNIRLAREEKSEELKEKTEEKPINDTNSIDLSKEESYKNLYNSIDLKVKDSSTELSKEKPYKISYIPMDLILNPADLSEKVKENIKKEYDKISKANEESIKKDIKFDTEVETVREPIINDLPPSYMPIVNELHIPPFVNKIQPSNKIQGWHLMNEFIDKDNNVFQKGKFIKNDPSKAPTPPKKVQERI